MRCSKLFARLASAIFLFLSACAPYAARGAVQITERYLPQYVIKGSAEQLLQSAAYLEINGLSPGETYRYFTGATTDNNWTHTHPGAATPGGYFGLTPDSAPNGDGLVDGYASVKSMAGLNALLHGNEAPSTSRYSMLTADASGNYSGWFSVVPDGTSPPFTTGNSVYFYIQLNTPGGTSITQSLHTSNTMTVLTSATTGSNSATAVGGYAGAAVGSERMVLLYDDVTGASRPIWGTWTEFDGVSPTNPSFSTWYTLNVGGTIGAWGAYIPNNLANGIRRIEYRDENANLLYALTSADGTWTKSDLSGTLSTVNPAGGNAPLFISAAPQTATTLNWSNAASTGIWNTGDLNWTAGAATVSFSNVTHDAVAFPDGPMVGGVTIAGSVTPSSVSVSNASGIYHFAGGTIAGNASFSKSGAGTVELAAANSYTGGTTITAGKILALAQDALPNSAPLTITSGRAEIASRAATDGNKKTLVLSTLTLSGDGVLDLNDNDLLIRSGSDSQVRQWLANGQSAASLPKILSTWAGTHSGHGLGFMTAADYAIFHPGTDFNGQPIPAGSVVVAYTRLGDATLDGNITLDDYAQIEAGFFFGHFDGTTRIASWDNGDFNYDGKVDYLDYALIDAAFAQGNALAANDLMTRHTAQFGAPYVIAVDAFSAQVPEPATLPLLVTAAIMLLRRGRQISRQ